VVLEVANARLDWLLQVLYLFLKNRGSKKNFNCKFFDNDLVLIRSVRSWA